MTADQALQNLNVAARAFVGTAEQHEALAVSLQVLNEVVAKSKNENEAVEAPASH